MKIAEIKHHLFGYVSTGCLDLGSVLRSDFRHLASRYLSVVSRRTFDLKPVGLLKDSRFSGMFRSSNSGGLIVCYICDFFLL